MQQALGVKLTQFTECVCRCSYVFLPLHSTSSSGQQQTKSVNCVNFTPGALRQTLYYATATTKTNKSIRKRTKTNTNKPKTRKQARAVNCVNFTPQAIGLSTSCDWLFSVVFIVVLVFCNCWWVVQCSYVGLCWCSCVSSHVSLVCVQQALGVKLTQFTECVLSLFWCLSVPIA